MTRPTLLLYCQHSVGMGHLTRSFALAAGLTERFRVVFLNGGPMPADVTPPRDVEIVDLPPIGMLEGGRLTSGDPRFTLEEAQRVRREMILASWQRERPAVIVVELFPFGRAKFAGEILPLLDAARAGGARRPVVACSVRDILVTGRARQTEHDDRASTLANAHFDAVLVHADPRFARLEESFKPNVPLRTPVHYTGFVAPADTPAPGGRATRRARRVRRVRRVVVSAGGGLVGEPLLRAAIEAQPRLWASQRLGMLVVAGPLLPEDAWRCLQTAAAGRPGLALRRAVPNLCDVLRRSALSVSQCGYNTALDVARAGVRALYVPYAAEHETEQTDRARRLARMSAARVLDAAELSAERLAAEIAATASFRPAPLALDLTGAARSARLLDELLQERLDADRAPKAAPLTQLALPGGVR